MKELWKRYCDWVTPRRFLWIASPVVILIIILIFLRWKRGLPDYVGHTVHISRTSTSVTFSGKQLFLSKKDAGTAIWSTNKNGIVSATIPRL